MDVISKLEALFSRRGGAICCVNAGRPVTVLAHSLQCAQMAEWAEADVNLVAAAFLHDVGQFLDSPAESALLKLHHETRALPWLAMGGFKAEVLEPIRMHTEAGRYLASVDAWRAVERNVAVPDSLRLKREGGRMSVEACRAFMRQPFADSALQLARWDDLARMPDKRTPPLDYYLRMLDDLLRTHQPKRLSVA